MKKNNKEKPLVIIQCYEDRQPTLPLRKPTILSNGTSSSETPAPKKEATDNPPPPPPMPITNGTSTANGFNKPTKSHPKNDIGAIDSNLKNGTIKRIPTPDYNNKIVTNGKKSSDDGADIESLESYKLKNPASVQPKPPSTYFVRAPNGTATMKKHGRPVSVTIGEYPNAGTGRKEPSKLDFLANEKANGVDVPDNVPISNRFQSELALTLSRSNLRKKTDSIVDAGR